MLKKNQPTAHPRKLLTFDSMEDPAEISNHPLNGAEPYLTNTAHQSGTRVNAKNTNPMDANRLDENPMGKYPTGENPTYPHKFLAQFIIVTCCIIITLVITHNHSRPSTWTRARIHTAVNATEESTFGYLFNSKLFQSIVTNGKNLIRLEEITKKIIDPNRYSSANSSSETGVLPVQGQISRGFGPQVSLLDGQQQYSTGVGWITLPGTEVLAIKDGIVVSVIPANSAGAGDEGGMITIDQGSGLSAIYHSLAGIRVNPGVHVKKGHVLGQTISSEFFLEVKRNGLFIDPLTLNLN